MTDVKVLATGLGAGILVDATLIRCLLVPALVSLFGAYNWWLPAWAARLLRVAPSPLHPQAPGRGERAGGSGAGAGATSRDHAVAISTATNAA
jgi:RND superfamily putative drug exporter